MRFGLRFSLKRLLRKERGGVAVEFAILLPVFMLLLFGVIDFGHAFYLQQVVTSASREGARYATKYHTDAAGNQILPANLSPSIPNYVINTSAENGGNGGYGLTSLLPSGANHQEPGVYRGQPQQPGHHRHRHRQKVLVCHGQDHPHPGKLRHLKVLYCHEVRITGSPGRSRL
jgi:hypothetical protein